MNKVILCGRLTRDPEVRYSQNAAEAIAIAHYTLAVDRRRNKKEEQATDFINIVAFGKSGEFAEKYLKKGTKMIVTGRIQTGSYTNKDGVKVYTTEVVAEDQEFAESKASSGNTAPMAVQQTGYQQPMPVNGYQQPVMMQQSQPMQQMGYAQPMPGDGFMNVPVGIPDFDPELPFN